MTGLRGVVAAMGLALGLGCGDTVPAVAAVVQFEGLAPGCVRGRAGNPATGEESSDVFPVEEERGQYRIAIYRPSGWPETVTVRVEGLEKDCDGPVVAREQQDATFPERGFNQLTFVLAAVDDDADGYVSTGAALPGRDCDDADHLRAPDVVELCDGKDNDCDGSADEDGVCG